MLWRPTYHKRVAQLVDGLATAASFVVAYFIWNWFRIISGVGRPIPITWDELWKILIFSIIWVIIFTRQNAYSYQRFTSIKKELLIVAKTTIFGVLIFFAAFFLFRFGYIPRSYIAIFALVNFISLSLEKFILFYAVKVFRKIGKNRKKIVVVGTGNRAKNFIETVEKNLGWGLDIIGLISGDKSKVGMDFYGYKVIGSNDKIEKILHQIPVDEVIICVSTKRFDHIRDILECCEREGVQVNRIYELAKENGALGGKISGAGGGGFFLFYVEENRDKFREKMKKLGLREMRYRFDFEGTKVLVNFMDGVR